MDGQGWMDGRVQAALDTLSACVDVLAGLPVAGADGRDVAGVVLAAQKLSGRLEALAASLLPVVEADGWWAVEGAQSSAQWLAVSARIPHSTAAMLVAAGRAMRDHLPATAAAAVAGVVPFDRVVTLTRVAVTSDARRAALADPASACGEGFLLAQARLLGADQFRRLVTRWAAAADPGSDERGHQDATDREFVGVAPTTGGFHLSGFLTIDHGAILNTALGALMRPPTRDETRTTQQRRAGALVDLARLTLDHDLTRPGAGGGVRPHLTCVVDYDTLHRTLTGHSPDDPDEDEDRHDGDGDGDRDGDSDGGDGDRGGDGDDGGGGDRGGGDDGDARRRAGRGASGGDGPSRAGRAGGRSRPVRLTPVADIERFAVAEILGAGPIPPSVLARLACDSDINRLIFGPQSQVIDAGRTERTYNGIRRRAILARDQTCRYPHCDAPPALTEIHHTRHWARDHGTTHTDTGITLCWHHHTIVHQHNIDITRTPTGGWTFTRRDRGGPPPTVG